MKLRMPGTLSAATSEIRGKLSEGRCAKIVDRSTSLIRKWANPDDPALPNMRQSLLLDGAYAKAGFGEPPIQIWYDNRLDDFVNDPEANDALDIVVSTVRAQALLGKISSAVDIFSEGHSKIGGDLSSNERATLLSLVEDLTTSLEIFESSLRENFGISGPIAPSENP